MNIGVGICDGIAMGHEGMKYSLPSREINRDCIIDMVKAHGIFDGIVYITACDKIIEESCPPVGSCTGLFTANSRACVTEALGLTVPGMASAHAISNKNYRK